MKDYPLLLAFFLLTFFHLSAEAGANSVVLSSIPLTGQAGEVLVVANPSNQDEPLWLAAPSDADNGVEESQVVVKAQSKLKINLDPWLHSPWLQLHAVNENLLLYLAVPGENTMSWPWGTSSSLGLNEGLPHAEIWLSNLTPIPQQVQVKGADGGPTYLTLQLSPQETRKLTWRDSSTKTAGRLVLQGEYRIAARFRNALSKKSSAFVPLTTVFQPSPPPEASAHFVLENPDHSQSFVVELKDANLIEQARQQIAQPLSRLSRMLVARVTPGNASLNFNPRDLYRSPWSWHVEEVYRFADFGSIDCDGSPELMEQVSNWWIKNRNGLICFWNYKVKAELQYEAELRY